MLTFLKENDRIGDKGNQNNMGNLRVDLWRGKLKDKCKSIKRGPQKARCLFSVFPKKQTGQRENTQRA